MEGTFLEKDVYTLIMAGGIGSRFWPKSRHEKPKQFIDMMGLGQSLLQATYDRARLTSPPENIMIATNGQYANLIAEQLPVIQENIIIEPSRNNTAPCIAYAAFKLYKQNKDAIMVIVPSDHVIANTMIYKERLFEAITYAANNKALVTLGILPTRADTGYGYIQYNKAGASNVFKVNAFKEKPVKEVAESYVASGDYLWNAGIFIWRADAILAAFDQHANALYEQMLRGISYYNTPAEQVFIKKEYPQTPNISIDYAVMEKADNVYTIPSDIGWSDLGTWNSQHSISDKDEDDNVSVGGISELFDTKGCMISTSKGKLVVIDGLEDYIIADDNNVLLIYPKNKEQQIKRVTEGLKLKGLERYL